MTPPRVRVHEISKVLGVSNALVISLLKNEFNQVVKSHSSTVDQEVADQIIARFKAQQAASPAASSSLKDKPVEEKQERPSSGHPEAPKSASVSPQPYPGKASGIEPPANQPKLPELIVRPGQPPAFSAPAPSPANASVSPQQPYPGKASGIEPPANQPRMPEAVVRPGQPPASPASAPTPSHSNASVSQQPYPGKASGIEPPANQPRMPEAVSRPGQPSASPASAPAPSSSNASVSPPRPYPGKASGIEPPANQPRMPEAVSRPGQPPAFSGGRPGIASPSQRPPQQQQHQRPGGASGRPMQRRGGRPQKGFQRPDESRLKKEEALPAVPKIVTIKDSIVVRDLAEKLQLRETEIIRHLFMKGMMVTVNQVLDADFARGVATELGFEVKTNDVDTNVHEGEYVHLGAEGRKQLDSSQYMHLQSRSPVVSIMGHVDHGKTTLLDSIRETRHKVVDSEAGGITQSIGAYTVEKDGHRIVFLDTPGHEAFTAMRMRGAKATDIAILVVAADDGVMPQTIEAINHAKAARIPILVAVNKIDKADADPDRVLAQLADHGLSPEKWGGDTLAVEVSALQKAGLDELLDSILLVAELLELKGDETVPAEGVVIEAQLDKRTGPIASVLVQNGTLKVGDNVLIGSVGGRVRALIDDYGARVQKAGPATPVEILGLDGVPNAGDPFQVVRDDKLFKRQLAQEKQNERNQRIGVSRSISAGFSGKSELESENTTKESQFNLLVKADTQGSLEAVLEVLQRMSNEEVRLNIVHSATGDINEADIMLSSTANALIIGFNNKTDATGQRLAEQEGVSIKHYNVIYHITEDIEKWLLGQLEPEMEEVLSGTAEVRQIFKVGKTGTIAGCMITSGKILRNARASVRRAGKEVYTGQLNNLKRFKDDAKEVASGYECGISFDRFQDLQEGDIIEVYVTKALERTSL